MASRGPDEFTEKTLVALLGRILDSQRFAEAKNAGLLAVNSAWLVASVNILTSGRELSAGVAYALAVAICFVVASSFLAIFSLLPRTDFKKLMKRQQDDGQCLIFFEHIAKMDGDAYRQAVSTRYRMKSKAYAQHYIADLTGQITANSRVASRKFYLFNFGAWLTVSACIAVCVPGAVWLAGTLDGKYGWLMPHVRQILDRLF